MANMLCFREPCLCFFLCFVLSVFPLSVPSSCCLRSVVDAALVVVQPKPSLAFFSSSLAQLFSNFAAAEASCWHLMSLHWQFKILQELIWWGLGLVGEGRGGEREKKVHAWRKLLKTPGEIPDDRWWLCLKNLPFYTYVSSVCLCVLLNNKKLTVVLLLLRH